MVLRTASIFNYQMIPNAGDDIIVCALFAHNQSCRLLLFYSHHGAPLLAVQYTTISEHTMEQDYVVNRLTAIYGFQPKKIHIVDLST